MPQYNRKELDDKARENGYNRDTFEKVLRLEKILAFLNTDKYMREHLLLKGGTAINLTVFKLPRLSVDIDLDFIPNLTRDETIMERVKLIELLKNYMADQGYSLSEMSRFSHSLDAFHFNYTNAAGNKDMLKIEINYSLRTHILLPEDRAILSTVFGEMVKIRTVAAIEIFAAKVNALISRAAARDLYDLCNMIEMNLFSDEKDMFRKCIIFYATISAKEVNKVFDVSAIDSLNYLKIKSDLIPVLAKKDKFALEEKKKAAKEYITQLMKPTAGEIEYMEYFTRKQYKPELLFGDEEILERIRDHPMALWKCK